MVRLRLRHQLFSSWNSKHLGELDAGVYLHILQNEWVHGLMKHLEIWRILKFQSHRHQVDWSFVHCEDRWIPTPQHLCHKSPLGKSALPWLLHHREWDFTFLSVGKNGCQETSEPHPCKIQMASRSLLLMVQKSGVHQLRLVAYPIIYRVWDTSKRWLAWFLNHQP